MIEPNRRTLKYISSNIKGYVDKSIGIDKFQDNIKKLYKLDKIIRFDLGENSDGPSTRVLKELEHIKNSNIIKEYPDSNYFKLKKELSLSYGVDIDKISIGAGSCEIIQNINKCWLEIGDRAIFPIPSFYVIENIILGFGGIPIHIQLMKDENFDENFQWTDDITNELILLSNSIKPKLIWLVTPNNPTGGIIPIDDIIRIIDNNQNSIVVVDEAYGEYIDESAIDFVDKYENLLVLRTFSKAYGMAGLRLGYCIGPKKLIKVLEQVRLEFPITSITERLGIIALRDTDHLAITRRKLAERKKILLEKLDKINNCEYIPSKTNIMLIKLKNKTNLYQKLLKKGILTAKMDFGGVDDYVRITIKDNIDNDLLIKSLMEINKE